MIDAGRHHSRHGCRLWIEDEFVEDVDDHGQAICGLGRHFVTAALNQVADPVSQGGAVGFLVADHLVGGVGDPEKELSVQRTCEGPCADRDAVFVGGECGVTISGGQVSDQFVSGREPDLDGASVLEVGLGAAVPVGPVGLGLSKFADANFKELGVSSIKMPYQLTLPFISVVVSAPCGVWKRLYDNTVVFP